MFDSGKTSSYHLKSVVACQQSNKNSTTFKLVVHSGADRNKRYEFDAENPKLAGAPCLHPFTPAKSFPMETDIQVTLCRRDRVDNTSVESNHGEAWGWKDVAEEHTDRASGSAHGCLKGGLDML